ncbi:MAG: hypothetical protein COV67_04210 [Nitrospinae bacterium CG11_big_fil_rev_8_21_14_0_20_56_8]|nr:MAG: hypothetical protein COV67_04210 [Nitrospinae bacterium CG11_big_fil_rev_8_21_14_0_20_56_8]
MPTRPDLAKIHIAKKELDLGDGLYREFLRVMFRKSSARDLSPQEVEELLEHFRTLGWKPRPASPRSVPSRRKTAGPPTAPFEKKYDDLGIRRGMATPAQLRKIEATWMTGPGIRIKTLHALRHFLMHFFHVADLRYVKAYQVTPILAAIGHVAHAPEGKHEDKPETAGKRKGSPEV